MLFTLRCSCTNGYVRSIVVKVHQIIMHNGSACCIRLYHLRMHKCYVHSVVCECYLYIGDAFCACLQFSCTTCYVRFVVCECSLLLRCSCTHDYYVRSIVFELHQMLRVLYRSLNNALHALNAIHKYTSAKCALSFINVKRRAWCAHVFSQGDPALTAHLIVFCAHHRSFVNFFV